MLNWASASDAGRRVRSGGSQTVAMPDFTRPNRTSRDVLGPHRMPGEQIEQRVDGALRVAAARVGLDAGPGDLGGPGSEPVQQPLGPRVGALPGEEAAGAADGVGQAREAAPGELRCLYAALDCVGGMKLLGDRPLDQELHAAAGDRAG